MTADVNAVAEALKEAGVEKVIVRDCHGSANTLLYEKLSLAVDEVVMGSCGDVRFPNVEGCDAIILLGYHAKAGTHQAILEHTYNSSAIQNYWINGMAVGEATVDAALAGDRGLPVMMVSGDDKLKQEVEENLPWAEYAQVKVSNHLFGGMLPHRQNALKVLKEKAKAAVSRFEQMQVYQVPAPVTLRIEKIERGSIPSDNTKPGMKIIDGRTYEITGDTMTEIFFLR